MLLTVTLIAWFSLGPAVIPVRGRLKGPGDVRRFIFVRAFKVGGSFEETTVSWNIRLLVAAPSETNTVMFALPDWFGAGVMRMVRLLPLPSKAMPALATNEVLPERADRLRSGAGVSTSRTMTAMSIGVSSSVD